MQEHLPRQLMVMVAILCSLMGLDSRPAAADNASDESSSTGPALQRKDDIAEIVVTAQKKSENIQDVPIPVTVLDVHTLLDNNQLEFRDYYSTIPGVNFDVGNRGEPIIALRGIANIYGNPTVGIVVDDIPQGSSIGNGGAFTSPDIDPSDLQRVEVLRGPQGTLYGATSMGGLIKYVTVDPVTDALTGRIQAGTENISNGSGLGYTVRAAINVPLGDTLAIRASAYSRGDPGYIENIVSSQDGVNKTGGYGGRLAAIWKPSDSLSIRLSGLIQSDNADGSPLAEPSFGGLKQSILPGTGWYDRRNQAYSMIVTAKIGDATLTSLTGYNSTEFRDSGDVTAFYGSLAQSQFNVAGSGIPEGLKNERLSQELRLAIPLAEKVDWLLGGFFSNEHTTWYQITTANDASTGQQVGVLDASWLPSTYKEYSLFTNFTVNVSERFDIQLGARETKDEQTYGQTDVGQFGLDGGNVPTLSVSEHAFTYLLTPQFKFTPDLMAYLRFASGYRPGGPNVPAPGVALPPLYGPDKTQNYEIGVKGNILEHALSFDASLYYIDWKNIQLTLFQNGFTYYANGGTAKSQGIELSAEGRPADGLSIAGWIAFNDAVLTENLPATSTAYGVSGDRLPLAARFSGNLSVDQDFLIANGWTGFAGIAESYVGGRLFSFQSTPERQEYPAYSKLDVHAGARHSSWTINLYAKNVANSRGLIGGGIGSTHPNQFIYIQPRTIGISVAKTF
jgi:outer membrane receptor protein involved in Fe transport